MRVPASYIILALISLMYLLLFLDLIKEAFIISGVALGLSLYVVNKYLALSKCISRIPIIHISSHKILWREEVEANIRHPCKEANIEAQVDPHLRIYSLPIQLIIEPPKSIGDIEAGEGTYMSLKPYDYLEPATHMHWLTSARLNQLITRSPRDPSLRRESGTTIILEWSKCMSEGIDVRRIDKALALLNSIQISNLCLVGPNGCIKVKPNIYEIEKLYRNPPEIAVFTDAAGGRRTMVITSMKCIDFSSFILMLRRLPGDIKIILATPEPRTAIDTRGLPVEVI